MPPSSVRSRAGISYFALVACSALGSQCNPTAGNRAITPPIHSSPSADPSIPRVRTAWVGTISAGCPPSDLELVLPFYEGLRFEPAAAALREAKSEYLDLAYPGPLSMPLVAWRCGDGDWTA